TLYGYVVSPHEINLKNYLDENVGYSDSIMNILKKENRAVALLRNLWVDEECRGQGEGSYLVGEFLQEASQHGADTVLLVCDNNESQLTGFKLQEFYEGFDFVACVNKDEDPLMVNDEDLAEKIAKAVKRQQALEADFEPN